MSRTRTAFFCTDCGHETPRWQGQCPACLAWNTLVEEPLARPDQGLAVRSSPGPAPAPLRLAEIATEAQSRWSVGLAELDFVLGGGLVPASLILVGGEPGIGKSTLMLQVAARLQAGALPVLYVSGEESAAQIRLRADRLGEPAGDVSFLAETRLAGVLDAAALARPAALFVDSIQTMYLEELEGAPGNVTQVRECAARLQRFAKETGTAVFLVGHVTKGGVVAGPRTLEHIVDTVLYFEGEPGSDHRVLRATKNRFGGVDEIGVFRMTAAGLVPVTDVSEVFLAHRQGGRSGSAVAAVMEGSRPLLVEVQALCTRTSWGSPQRASQGVDRQRLALLLAVLEKWAGVSFGELDVFTNVVGGVRVVETASDLALAVALVSSVLDRELPPEALFVGELGLAGELRAVPLLERRLTEAARLGFRRVYLAQRTGTLQPPGGLELVPVSDIRQLMPVLFP